MAEAAVVQLLFFTGGTGKMLAALEHLRDVITTWRKKQLNVYVSLSKKKGNTGNVYFLKFSDTFEYSRILPYLNL